MGVLVQPAKAASTSTDSLLSAPVVIPDDVFWDKQWYLRAVKAPEAWAVTTGTRDVIVAVIDGGVDINHQDLRDNIWTNSKEIPGDGLDNDQDGYADDVHGWNFVTNSPDVRPVRQDTQLEEAWSHGTIVSSLIAAKGNDGRGISGINWNARIMPLVILDANGQGSVENLVSAMRYAVNHGVEVINLSLVGYDYEPELEEMIKRANDAGVVIVAATGNDEIGDGLDLDLAEGYPVCLDGPDNRVLGVSGTDKNNRRAPGANYGKNCTDLTAPGDNIFAARPSYPHDTKPTSTVPGFHDGYSGTSLAAPLVSGVAALLKGIHPEWTPKQVRQRILETVDVWDEHAQEPDSLGKLGIGRLDAGRALAPDRVVAVNPKPTTSLTKATKAVSKVVKAPAKNQKRKPTSK